MRYPLSRQNNCDEALVKDLMLDAVELIDVVLARSLDFPRCYNLISIAVQKLHKDANGLVEAKAKVTGEEYVPVPIPRSFLFSMPGGSASMAPERDSRHLLGLLHRLMRPGARANAVQVKKILDQEAKTMALKRHSIKVHIITELLTVLPRFENRPHVYNLVIGRIQMLQTEPSKDTFWSEQKGNLFGRFRKTAPNWVVPFAKLKSKVEDRPAAEDRWKDVMAIDDIVEAFPDVSHILNELKYRCHEEAKLLQKRELSHLMNIPAAFAVF